MNKFYCDVCKRPMPNEKCYKLHLEGKAHRKEVRNAEIPRRTMAEEAYFRRFPVMVASASASSAQNSPALTTPVVGKVPVAVVKDVSSSVIPDTQTARKTAVEASDKCNPVEKVFIDLTLDDPVLPTP